MQNALKSNEWWWSWVYKTFKIKIQKGGPNNSSFLQTSFPPESRSPLFDWKIFQDSEKITIESYKMHWNLMKDEQSGSVKLLKLKYRRRGQIIQTFCKIGFIQKLDAPSFICKNFKTLRKALLNHTKRLEIWWRTKNLGPLNF